MPSAIAHMWISDPAKRDSNPRVKKARRISSQPRYDHFDNPPCIFQSAFFYTQISVKKFLERKAGENTKKYSIFYFESPYI